MIDLAGRSAVITGAQRGIGQACALAMARAGAEVVVSDITMDSLSETLDELRKLGAKAVGIAADMADPAQINAMISGAARHLGKLDAAINCAGVYDRAQPGEWDDDDFDRVMRINVRSVYSCLKTEVALMLENGGGAIVNIVSVAGFRGGKGLAYVTSKHAAAGLTKTVALAYADRNIRINAVCPGPTDTVMMREAGVLNAKLQGVYSGVPIGRIGRTEEIAAAAAWLCSDAASFITGTLLPVDGGLTAG